MMMLSLQVMAYDFSYTHQGKTLFYDITSGNTVAVTYYRYNNNYVSGDVVIPSTVIYNGTTYSVTSIGELAFYGCSGLTSVTIGNSVTSIGDLAFYGCSSLTSVTIPNSVTSIGSSAFEDCIRLTTLNFNSINCRNFKAYRDYDGNYYYYPFSGTSLTTVNIGDSVRRIPANFVRDCWNLTLVTIPNSVTSIGDSAFIGCSGLTSINVASGNTHYSSIDGVLYNYVQDTLILCPKAKTSVTIPNSVISIGDYAFAGCSGLTSVTIPNSVTSIGDKAFAFCSGLTSVTIPNSVTSIGKSAFSGCSGLTSVTIPNSVTSIGRIAFSGCSGLTTLNFNAINCQDLEVYSENGKHYPFSGTSLTTVNIGDSVQRIPKNFVRGCSGLTSVTIPNSVTSIGSSAFSGCSGLVSVVIGDGITNIGRDLFGDCPYLTYLTIGRSVESIENGAFLNCSLLSQITSWASVPPEIGGIDAFPHPNNCTVTVPCGSLGAYTQQTNRWNLLFNGRISEGLSFGLSVSANDEAYGRVEVENHSCESKTLTAIANEGYEFTGWNDGNTENPRTVTVTSDTTFMAIFTASGSSSLQEVNAREFALYPNPAKNFVILDFEALKTNIELQIFDIRGIIVKTENVKAGEKQIRIDLSNLSKGTYLIKFGNTTKKIVVE